MLIYLLIFQFYSDRKFVKAKKYKTDAENFGWSFVLEMFVPKEVSDKAKDRIQVIVLLQLRLWLLA